MNEFNETYEKIISEGLLRKAKQLFKSKESNSLEIYETVKKVFENNGFVVEGRGYKKGALKIILGKSFSDPNASKKSIKINTTISKTLDFSTSDTIDEVISALNKALNSKVKFSNESLTVTEKDMTQNEKNENEFKDYE